MDLFVQVRESRTPSTDLLKAVAVVRVTESHTFSILLDDVQRRPGLARDLSDLRIETIHFLPTAATSDLAKFPSVDDSRQGEFVFEVLGNVRAGWPNPQGLNTLRFHVTRTSPLERAVASCSRSGLNHSG